MSLPWPEACITDLRSALERYLNMRQGLGSKYHQARNAVQFFVSFMETYKARDHHHEADDGIGDLADPIDMLPGRCG